MSECRHCGRLFSVSQRTERLVDMQLQSSFDFGITELRYHDDDGDCVTVASHAELNEAMAHFRSVGRRPEFVVFHGFDRPPSQLLRRRSSSAAIAVEVTSPQSSPSSSSSTSSSTATVAVAAASAAVQAMSTAATNQISQFTAYTNTRIDELAMHVASLEGTSCFRFAALSRRVRLKFHLHRIGSTAAGVVAQCREARRRARIPDASQNDTHSSTASFCLRPEHNHECTSGAACSSLNTSLVDLMATSRNTSSSGEFASQLCALGAAGHVNETFNRVLLRIHAGNVDACLADLQQYHM